MLSLNPEAQQLHDAGLRAQLVGDFDQAHQSFESAEGILAATEQTMDAVVQTGRIVCDDGRMYGLAALAAPLEADVPPLLDEAEHTIRRSLAITAPIITGVNQLCTELPQPHGTSKVARREAIAEHGMAVSALGQIATLSHVIREVDTRGDSKAAAQARNVEQQPYGLAHDLLRLGNKGHYRVSNALAGARQERINGRLPHTAVWLGRAATGLLWTAVRDRTNLKPALRTTASWLRHLTSRQTAIKSVATHPYTVMNVPTVTSPSR